MPILPTVETTALAKPPPETTLVCDAATLASLPVLTASTVTSGVWSASVPRDFRMGSVDACHVDDGVGTVGSVVGSVAELATHLAELDKIDGAFHLACTQGNSLLLARDAIGHGTLFYAQQADGIAFASDVQSLLRRPGVSRTLDVRAIAAYLACAYIPGRATLFKDVRELLPGHTLRCASGSQSEVPFFRIPDEAVLDSDHGESLAIETLRHLLEAAVAVGLDPAQPAAAFLSGGIDSSVVVALVQRALSSPLHTFSVAFGAQYKHELAWSSMVAKHIGSHHTIVHVTPDAVLAALDQTHALLASPIGDPLTVPNAILFRAARAHATTVWNGEGGDPCFGGPKNLPMVLAELFGDGENFPQHASPRSRSYYRAHLKCFDELDAMLTHDAMQVVHDAPLEADVDPYFDDESRSFVGALSAINVTWKGGHHILPKVAQLAHAAGIAPRSPLFSKRVVEFASRLPPSMKLRGSVEKYALKQAVRDLLPAAVIDRPKSGMMVPVEGWFSDPLLAHARERLLGGALPFDILRREAIEALLPKKQDGLRPRRGVKIWLLIALESYLRQFHSSAAAL